MKFLDTWTGNNYLLFLTADHGAVNNPEFAKDRKLIAGKFENGMLADSVKKYLKQEYEIDSLVITAGANNIQLNRSLINAKNLSLEDVQNKCADFVSRLYGVSTAMTATELSRSLIRSGIASFIQNGFNIQRSSDVMIQLQPGWTDWYTKTGTSHGTAYSYDTHVPLIFFGKKIKSGTSAERITICDIAPTISSLLNIEFPSGNRGNVLTQLNK